jgi:hypothetical protein
MLDVTEGCKLITCDKLQFCDKHSSREVQNMIPQHFLRVLSTFFEATRVITLPTYLNNDTIMKTFLSKASCAPMLRAVWSNCGCRAVCDSFSSWNLSQPSSYEMIKYENVLMCEKHVRGNLCHPTHLSFRLSKSRLLLYAAPMYSICLVISGFEQQISNFCAWYPLKQLNKYLDLMSDRERKFEEQLPYSNALVQYILDLWTSFGGRGCPILPNVH